MTAPTCTILQHYAAACQKCGKYGDPRHAVEMAHIDQYDVEVIETKIYCPAHCPVCNPQRRVA